MAPFGEADHMFKMMDKSTHAHEKREERNGLLNEASRMRAIASAEGRKLTAAEELRVLQLMIRVQALDEEIALSER